MNELLPGTEVDLRGVRWEVAAFQEALLALVAPQLRRALRRKAYGDALAFLSLLKRSVSTATACAGTLETIARRLDDLAARGDEAQDERRQRLRTLRDLIRRRERFGYLSADEEQDQAALEAEDMAADLVETGADDLRQKLGLLERQARSDQSRLRELLKTRDALRALAGLAQEAAAEDPKLGALLEQIRAVRRDEPRANVLVYTEYTDSLDAAVTRLEAARQRGELSGEVLAIHGQHTEDERARITEAFTSRDDLILVSTDASAEGLNLHARCHHLVHLELPYNPNRIEQRNGRIDRFGQRFRRYLGERAARADELFKIMALMSREDVERIATLYAAWDDRLRDGRPATDADLVDDVLGWHEEKRQRFSGKKYVSTRKR